MTYDLILNTEHIPMNDPGLRHVWFQEHLAYLMGPIGDNRDDPTPAEANSQILNCQRAADLGAFMIRDGHFKVLIPHLYYSFTKRYNIKRDVVIPHSQSLALHCDYGIVLAYSPGVIAEALLMKTHRRPVFGFIQWARLALPYIPDDPSVLYRSKMEHLYFDYLNVTGNTRYPSDSVTMKELHTVSEEVTPE